MDDIRITDENGAFDGILKLIDLVVPLKVSSRDEGLGMDVSQHGEEAYAKDDGALLILPKGMAPRPAVATATMAEGGRA